MCSDIWPTQVTGQLSPTRTKDDERLQKRWNVLVQVPISRTGLRESAKTDSKTVAREAERARRRDLELGYNRIAKRERVPLFAVAAKEWLSSKSALTPLGRVYYEQYSRKVVGEFGTRLVSDIGIAEISQLQTKRLGEGLSARTVTARSQRFVKS
jgi:hypothetical protein